MKLYCRIFVAVAALLMSLPVHASTFASNAFDPYPQGRSFSSALLLASDGNFYGTAQSGGAFGYGTIYRLTPGGAFSTIYNFQGAADGNTPTFALIQGRDGALYGTTSFGGTYGCGLIFKLTLAGQFTPLYEFTSSNQVPSSSLTQDANGNLLGVGQQTIDDQQAINAPGILYSLNPNGTFQVLVQFGGPSPTPGAVGTSPRGAVTVSADGTIFGTTSYGGASNDGTAFSMTPSGQVTTLASFNAATSGAGPIGGLVIASDGNYYGVTNAYGGPSGGGSGNYGTAYRLTPSGTLTGIATFQPTDRSVPTGLTLGSDGNLYGATALYLTSGTLFKLTTSGMLTTLYQFAGGTGGTAPPIQGADGNLYGTTEEGGTVNLGTIYRYSLTGGLTVLFNAVSVDGALPYCTLVQTTNGSILGTTDLGGASNMGSIFEVTPSGKIVTIASFDSTNGAHPQTGMIQARDGNLYGTAQSGPYGQGGVFRLTPSGTLTILANMAPNTIFSQYTPLIQASDGNLYGTTYSTIYRVSLNGTLTTFYDFGVQGASNKLTQGSDGDLYGETTNSIFKISLSGTLTTVYSFGSSVYPGYGLVQATDGNFYGTTSGPDDSPGTIFRLNPAGQLFTLDYLSSVYSTGSGTNNNASTIGYEPLGALIQARDGNFYGTTFLGGQDGGGTVFQMVPSGTVTPLVAFDGPNGYGPIGSVMQARDGTFYGTTLTAQYGFGAVYHLDTGTLTSITFDSPGDIPVAAQVYTISGSSLNLALKFAPAQGTVLTVIQDTGVAPISGTFANLPDGGTITATFGTTTYTFTASYEGGAGYDLTLTLTGISAPRQQVVTFEPIGPQVYGGTVTLTGNASSGLPVGYGVISGPAKVSGHTLTFTDTGTVVVEAAQRGNATYASASAQQTVTVGKAPQTISAFDTIPPIHNSATPIQIAPYRSLAPTATSGLPVSITVLSGPATISGGTLITTGVGTVTLAANQPGNANYLPAPEVTTSFVIQP